MSEDFKKWLRGLLGLDYMDGLIINLEVLIKCMWVINEKYTQVSEYPMIQNDKFAFSVGRGFLSSVVRGEDFGFCDGHESKTESLIKALLYIYENDL